MNGPTIHPNRRTKADRAHPDGCPCRSCRNRRHTELVRAVLLFLSRQDDVIAWEMKPLSYAPGVQRRTGPVGIADICGILSPSGRWLCLEAKTGSAVRRPSQVAWSRVARYHGAFYRVVHTVDEASEALNEARKGAT